MKYILAETAKIIAKSKELFDLYAKNKEMAASATRGEMSDEQIITVTSVCDLKSADVSELYKTFCKDTLADWQRMK